MWKMDHKEGWAPKINTFKLVVEKTLGSLLDSKEIKLVNPKGNQLWIFIGRTDAEAETSILWPPDAKSQLTGKDSDVWKDWERQEMAVDEMVGCHHQLSGHEFEQTPGDGEGHWSLACCNPWSFEESDTTEQLNNKGWSLHLISNTQRNLENVAMYMSWMNVLGFVGVKLLFQRSHLIYVYDLALTSGFVIHILQMRKVMLKYNM